MILGTCLYAVWGYYGVSMVVLFLFWICVSVVMLYVYSIFEIVFWSNLLGWRM